MKRVKHNRETPLAYGLVWCSLLLLLGAGIVLLSVETIPFSTVRALADRQASDGRADGFTEELYQGIVYRTRRGGILLLAYAAGLWLLRTRAIQIGSGIRRAIGRTSRVFRGAIAHWWHTAPGWERWGLIAALTAGLAVRLLWIQAPLRHDEAFTMEAYARTPVYRLLTDMREPNNHLLHTLLASISIRIFGDSEWALRLPALWAGWASIAAAFAAFRVLAGGGAALAAAVLMATQMAQIEYSVLARGYSLVTLFFLLGILTVYRWPQRPRSPVRRWAFTLIITLSLCTILSSLYVAAVLGTWLLLLGLEQKHTHWRSVFQAAAGAGATAAAFTVLFYFPAGLVHGPTQYFQSRFMQPAAFSYAKEQAIELAAGMPAYWGSGWPPAFQFFLWALALLGVVALSRAASSNGSWLPLPLLAPLLCFGLTLAQRVVHFRRSFLFLSPLFLGAAGCGLAWLTNRVRWQPALPYAAAAMGITAIFTVTASQAVYLSNEIGNARDIREATAYLQGLHLEARDHVSVTLVSSMPAIYYFRKAGIPTSVLDHSRTRPRRLFALEDVLPAQPVSGNAENRIMADKNLVVRIDGFDTEQMPPPVLLWQSRWCRLWLYDTQNLSYP